MPFSSPRIISIDQPSASPKPSVFFLPLGPLFCYAAGMNTPINTLGLKDSRCRQLANGRAPLLRYPQRFRTSFLLGNLAAVFLLLFCVVGLQASTTEIIYSFAGDEDGEYTDTDV